MFRPAQSLQVDTPRQPGLRTFWPILRVAIGRRVLVNGSSVQRDDDYIQVSNTPGK